jgi:hypothetical protein
MNNLINVQMSMLIILREFSEKLSLKQIVKLRFKLIHLYENYFCAL